MAGETGGRKWARRNVSEGGKRTKGRKERGHDKEEVKRENKDEEEVEEKV